MLSGCQNAVKPLTSVPRIRLSKGYVIARTRQEHVKIKRYPAIITNKLLVRVLHPKFSFASRHTTAPSIIWMFWIQFSFHHRSWLDLGKIYSFEELPSESRCRFERWSRQNQNYCSCNKTPSGKLPKKSDIKARNRDEGGGDFETVHHVQQ